MKPCLKNVSVGAVAAAAFSFLVMTGGCTRFDLNNEYTTPDRLEKGLIVILPGIEGESSANHDIRKGLYEGGIPYGLVIYRWGSGSMLMNQTNVEGNRRSADELAGHIAKYQRNHPGKPVFIMGHSAGGGVAIFTLESLSSAGGSPIEGAFLLSSSISSDYDLTYALKMTRRGLVNVSNNDDQLLNSGTKTLGNVDGGRGESAGRVGFSRSYKNVFERPITTKEVQEEFNTLALPHFAITNDELIEKYAPRWIMSQTWPPTTARK